MRWKEYMAQAYEGEDERQLPICRARDKITFHT